MNLKRELKLVAEAAGTAAALKVIEALGAGDDSPPGEFLNTLQAAAYLNVSHQFLEIARHRGEGPTYIRLGGRAIRYGKKNDLDVYMDARRQRPDAENGGAK